MKIVTFSFDDGTIADRRLGPVRTDTSHALRKNSVQFLTNAQAMRWYRENAEEGSFKLTSA